MKSPKPPPPETGISIRERRSGHPRTYAAYISTAERRLDHLNNRLRDHGRADTGRNFDRGEALMLQAALEGLRRLRAEMYSGVSATELLRETLNELSADSDLAVRILRFLDDVDEAVR